MKNKFIMLISILSFTCITKVNAAPVSASITTTSNSATLTVSSSEHIGQIYGTFTCDGLGSKSLTFSATDNPPTSKSYTISWDKNTGTHTCSVNGFQVGTLESAHEGVRDYTVASKSFDLGGTSTNNTSNPTSNKTSNTTYNTNKTTTKKESNKSGNNDLKSLEIENYKISPEFDRNTTDYTLTVPNDVEKVKILAYKDDDNASLDGDDGEVEVKVGENNFEVIVIAENGDKKTYNLKITVEEKSVNVKVNGKEYNVVKNKDELPELSIEHEEMTLNIQEQEIPAYRIDNIGYILIGLRDAEGKVNLYKFDSFKNDEQEPTYELFNYIESKGILLINKEIPKNKIPKNYKKYTEKINDYEYIVYKLSKDSKFSLIYGLNIETRKEKIYRYNSEENTLQIYEREEQKILEKKQEQYEKLILILIVVIVILLLLTTIGFTKKAKPEIVDEELSKKDIKKIEKNTKKQEKKKKKKKEEFDL